MSLGPASAAERNRSGRDGQQPVNLKKAQVCKGLQDRPGTPLSERPNQVILLQGGKSVNKVCRSGVLVSSCKMYILNILIFSVMLTIILKN